MPSVRKLPPNERGSVVVALPLVVLLFVVMTWVAAVSQDVAAADVVLRESAALAVKAAASSHDPETGEIDFHRARARFERSLRDNLELDGGLKPREGSPLSDRPEYVLILYNGFPREDRPAGVRYEFSGGCLTEVEVSQRGFPAAFCLGEGVAVELDSPGAIAVVGAYPRRAFREPALFRRWAAAEVADAGGRRAVVLKKSAGSGA